MWKNWRLCRNPGNGASCTKMHDSVSNSFANIEREILDAFPERNIRKSIKCSALSLSYLGVNKFDHIADMNELVRVLLQENPKKTEMMDDSHIILLSGTARDRLALLPGWMIAAVKTLGRTQSFDDISQAVFCVIDPVSIDDIFGAGSFNEFKVMLSPEQKMVVCRFIRWAASHMDKPHHENEVALLRRIKRQWPLLGFE